MSMMKYDGEIENPDHGSLTWHPIRLKSRLTITLVVPKERGQRRERRLRALEHLRFGR